jgi:hypothetical protein
MPKFLSFNTVARKMFGKFSPIFRRKIRYSVGGKRKLYFVLINI